MKTITLNQAKKLKIGDILYDLECKNKDGSAQRWRVSGKVLRWKTMPDRIRVPLKYGLYQHAHLTEDTLAFYSLKEPKKAKVN